MDRFIAAIFINYLQSFAGNDDIFRRGLISLLIIVDFLMVRAILYVIKFAKTLEHFLFVLIVIIYGWIFCY